MLGNKFHIHIDVDATFDVHNALLYEYFEIFLMKELGFSLKNFSGVPADSHRHAPERHLTHKTQDSRAFYRIFDSIESYLTQHPKAMTGYIEGEYIPERIQIPDSEFNPNVAVPFKLELGSLPTGKFREDEIHITLDRDNSDPRLISSLRQMGFFSVYMDKDYGTAEIFTTQGYYHDIQTVLPLITNYLNQVGGAVNCVIKEERIVRSWMSAPDITLPPVITSIQQLAVAQPTHQLCVR